MQTINPAIKDLSLALNYWQEKVLRDYTIKKSDSLHKSLSLKCLQDIVKEKEQGGLNIRDYNFDAQFKGGAIV